jgi:uroporphyrinogen-III synthase
MPPLPLHHPVFRFAQSRLLQNVARFFLLSDPLKFSKGLDETKNKQRRFKMKTFTSRERAEIVAEYLKLSGLDQSNHSYSIFTSKHTISYQLEDFSVQDSFTTEELLAELQENLQ